MSTQPLAASPRVGWIPAASWWLLLACVLATGILGNWLLAAGVLFALLAQMARPYDFMFAFLGVTAGSTFVYYAGGNLTLQLSLVTAGVVLMLFYYCLAARGETFSVPRTELTRPLLVYLALSLVNTVRGFMYGYGVKDILFEIYPVLALSTSILVANLLEPKRDMNLILLMMTGTAFASAAFGFQIFAIIHTHTGGIFFHPLPGIMAVLFFNFALRTDSLHKAFAWIFLSLPLLLHQFLSFRRGLWVGIMAGLITSIWIFVRAPRSGERWKRVGTLLGTVAGLGVVGAIGLAVLYGQADVLEQAGGRFASIGGTDLTAENMSNIHRLIEYATVAGHILASPFIGHGLGFTFVVRNALTHRTEVQWWVHENYLHVWLKQGLLGLGIFIWMLYTAIRFGGHHARRREDPHESAWLAATAASTAFMAAFSLSDYPFDLMEAMFMMGLFWGVGMGLVRTELVTVRWSKR
jgi:hypothetical protein